MARRIDHTGRGTAAVLAVLSLAGAAAAQLTPPGVSAPPGFRLRTLVTGLDFPASVAFNGTDLWVAEAGFMPGMPPKVKRIDAQGNATTILSPDLLPPGALAGPLTDITYFEGWLWMVHRRPGGPANGWRVGAISRFRPEDPAGTFATVISGLPSSGDHHSDEIVFSGSGATAKAYFGQGTATNSSVVGPDNEIVEHWLVMFPGFHDYPPRDVTLSGESFPTPVPFALDPTASLVTAPYSPFGAGALAAGAVIAAPTPAAPRDGIIAGNGAIYSFSPNATGAGAAQASLRLEAWGVRNPFGVGLDPQNPSRVWVSNNGGDIRSAMVGGNLRPVEPRPVEGDYEDVFIFDSGAAAGSEPYFGWPDYYHDQATSAVLPVTDTRFCPPPTLPGPCPRFVFAESFRATLSPRAAFAQVERNSSVTKFDFAPPAGGGNGGAVNGFGFEGDVFLTESGAFVPQTGATAFTGYKVARVNHQTGRVTDFIVNRGTTPTELFNPAKLNKPIDLKFRNGRALIVDFGVFEPGLMLIQPGTGKLWVGTACRADFDSTGEVNANDVSAFLNEWFRATTATDTRSFADFDGSGQVDANDLSAFINDWYAAIVAGGGCDAAP